MAATHATRFDNPCPRHLAAFSRSGAHDHLITESNLKRPAKQVPYQLALAEKARGNQAGYEKAIEQMKLKFESISNEEKQWCEKTLISIALKA
jgi:hypothetical protein